MIIRKRGATKLVPAIIPGAIRVESLCILGVTISSDLKMDQHINRVLSSASSSLYALSTLRSKELGLPADSLHLVAQATTLSSAMYASPAWWGFASVENRDKIEALINRMKRREFLNPEHPSADGICMNQNHVLSSLLPRLMQHQYHMRTRAHNVSLPPKDDRNFFYPETFTETYTEYIHSIIIIVIVVMIYCRPATVLVLIFNLRSCTLNAVCHFGYE